MHFHVEKAGAWEIRVNILATTADLLVYEVRWGPGPTGRQRRELRRRVVEYREALIEEWQTKVQP